MPALSFYIRQYLPCALITRRRAFESFGGDHLGTPLNSISQATLKKLLLFGFKKRPLSSQPIPDACRLTLIQLPYPMINVRHFALPPALRNSSSAVS
jgi:hypothetical protein